MAQKTWRILVWQSIVEIRLVRCHVLSMISSSLIGKSCSVNPVQFPLKIKSDLLCIYKKGLNLSRYNQFFLKVQNWLKNWGTLISHIFRLLTLISPWLLLLIFSDKCMIYTSACSICFEHIQLILNKFWDSIYFGWIRNIFYTRSN